MPGEERWRLLDLEPTRALGHANKKYAPLHSPEIYEWVFMSEKCFVRGLHLAAVVYVARPLRFSFVSFRFVELCVLRLAECSQS